MRQPQPTLTELDQWVHAAHQQFDPDKTQPIFSEYKLSMLTRRQIELLAYCSVDWIHCPSHMLDHARRFVAEGFLDKRNVNGMHLKFRINFRGTALLEAWKGYQQAKEERENSSCE